MGQKDYWIEDEERETDHVDDELFAKALWEREKRRKRNVRRAPLARTFEI